MSFQTYPDTVLASGNAPLSDIALGFRSADQASATKNIPCVKPSESNTTGYGKTKLAAMTAVTTYVHIPADVQIDQTLYMPFNVKLDHQGGAVKTGYFFLELSGVQSSDEGQTSSELYSNVTLSIQINSGMIASGIRGTDQPLRVKAYIPDNTFGLPPDISHAYVKAADRQYYGLASIR